MTLRAYKKTLKRIEAMPRCEAGPCHYPTTCREKGRCCVNDDKPGCPHYDLPRANGAGCPDCNFEEDVEATIACLGDDAEQVRIESQRGADDPSCPLLVPEEWADNMEKAAKLLQHFLDCRRLSYPSRETPF